MISQFSSKLLKARHLQYAVFPAKRNVQQFTDDLIELLFPHFSGEYEYYSAEEIDGKFSLLMRDLKKMLKLQQPKMGNQIDEVCNNFISKIPDIYKQLLSDAHAIHEGDPASESIDEVISAYPGFFAIYTYRVAHEFYKSGIPIFPRLICEYAHFRTGIDIHPGAQINDSFFIDHGTGVVIGETTVIGKNVKIYQGVTLGALSVTKELAQTKRHPTIEDNVVIYSNATILGGETTIGQGSTIGGNVFLLESVPPNSIVYNKSDVKVGTKNSNRDPINFTI